MNVRTHLYRRYVKADFLLDESVYLIGGLENHAKVREFLIQKRWNRVLEIVFIFIVSFVFLVASFILSTVLYSYFLGTNYGSINGPIIPTIILVFTVFISVNSLNGVRWMLMNINTPLWSESENKKRAGIYK